VLGSHGADGVAIKIARAEQGTTANFQRPCCLLPTKRPHLAAVARESGRAIEGDEGFVDLESLADVLDTVRANLIS
jgi:hypothetical protein